MKGGPRALWALLFLFMAVATSYSLIVPPFETPDEIWHYAFIQQVATGGGLPVSEPETQALWRQQGVQAPGYYLLAAALTAGIDQRDFPTLYERANPHAAIGQPDLPNKNYFLHYRADRWPWHGALLALHVARLLSVLLGALTLWATFHTLRYLLPERAALLATALVAAIPQVAFIAGAASNDNAINAAAALLLWRLVALLEAPTAQGDRHFLLLGGLLGAALLAKISGVWLLVVAAGTILVQGARLRQPRWAARGLLLTLGSALLIAGWWFARNFWLYGDPGAMEIWRANILLRPDVASLRTIVGEWEGLHHSFWGLFGWFNVPYPLWLYRTLELLSLLIGAGLLLALARWWRRGRPLRPSVLLLLIWPLLLALSWLAFMRVAPAAQGRYFHPALPSLALLMVTGLSAWTGQRRPWIALGAAALLAMLSAVTPWTTIQPAYRPSAPLAALPPEATASESRYGGLLQLRGYEVAPLIVASDAPIPVTLYWQAERAIPDDFSISAKLLDSRGAVLATSDSMPDSGRWPTTQFPAEGLVVDRHWLQLIEAPTAPVAARLVVEAYRFSAPLDSLPTTLDGVPHDQLPGALVALRPTLPTGPTLPEAVRIVAPRVQVADGRATVSFEWEVGQPLDRDYQRFLHLVAEPMQSPLAQNDGPPLDDRFPTRFWLPGDRFTERLSLPLPTPSAPARYTLVAGLYDLESGARLLDGRGQGATPLATLRWDGEAWHVEP